MTFQFPDGYDDTPEIIIDRLRAELADVRLQWQADVGSAIARAQTAEARAEQYENGRWHSYETVQAIVKERDAARAEAARLRELLTKYQWRVPTAPHRYCLECGRGEIYGHDAECAIGAALREPARIEPDTRGDEFWKPIENTLDEYFSLPVQSEKPATRRQEANDV